MNHDVVLETLDKQPTTRDKMDCLNIRCVKTDVYDNINRHEVKALLRLCPDLSVHDGSCCDAAGQRVDLEKPTHG